MKGNLSQSLQLINANDSLFVTALFTASELHIVWRLGEVYNPPDGIIDEKDVLNIKYTLVIPENITTTEMSITNFAINVDSNEVIDSTEINVTLLEPYLAVSLDTRVCSCSYMYMCVIKIYLYSMM